MTVYHRVTDTLDPNVRVSKFEPYAVFLHRGHRSGKLIVEARPRAGVWAPVFAAVPISERETTEPFLIVEPSDVITGTGEVIDLFEGPSPDGLWWVKAIQGQATPTQSLYVWLARLPKRLRFGVPNRGPVFEVSLPL